MTSHPPARYLAIGLVLAAIFFQGSAQAREIVHEVKKGQNLGMIAKRYHTTTKAILETNQLSIKRNIYPGQKLRVHETEEHRKWREFYAEKLDPKRKRKAPEKKSTPPKKRTNKRIAKKKPEETSAKKPARATKRKPRADKRRRSQREKKPSSTQRKRYEKNGRSASTYSKPPRKPGLVTLVRSGRKFRGTLVSADGQVDTKAAKRVDRFMRSWRTGEKHEINHRLYRLLTQVSDHFGGRKIMVVSGYRPYRAKQFTKNSRHNHGKAIDFRVVGVPLHTLFDYCRGFDNVGCGSYPNSGFIHMDVREHKTQWTDFSRPGQAPIYAQKSAGSPTKTKANARGNAKSKTSRKTTNTKRAARKSKTAKSESDASKTAEAKSEAAKSEAAKSEAAKSEAAKSEAAKSDESKSDESKTAKSNSDKPKSDKPKSDESKTAKSETAKSKRGKRGRGPTKSR